jgi:hypothetical protein
LRVRVDADEDAERAVHRALAGPVARSGWTLSFADTGSVHARFRRTGRCAGEAYRLVVSRAACGVEAGSTVGLVHGARTLAQLLSAAAREPGAPRLAGLTIDDAPDFATRGVMLDVSRDRVPTMETLHARVELLASLKVNHLELYMEHTFAYAGHEDVWRDASPFTGAELRALDAFCRARHVELVPNQNSFGHMHRWLTHAKYAPLAECPQGIEHAFAVAPEPFSLCPIDPRALALLDDLYDQLLPHFESKLFNVGCDETFDLGLGRSRAACAERGKGRVYLEFLNAVHERVHARGRRMLFWGDVIVQHPEHIPHLPADAIALLWGYEDGHPFDEQARAFAVAGLPFWVCPGTSSWQSFLGRVGNARANLEQAAAAGRAHGASGYLVTDWGDYGHWQPAPVSLPGFVLGAARAWNAGGEPPDLARSLDLHALDDARGGAGAALLAFGDAHEALASPALNGTSLFYQLRYAHLPWPLQRAPGLTQDNLARYRVALDGARALLARHGIAGRAGRRFEQDLRWAADATELGADLAAARLAAGPGAHLGDLTRATRAALRARLAPLVERHRALWVRRDRPGGLRESASRFESVARLLEGPG